MLKKLYDWTLSLAARKSAEWWLGFISFVESSIFLVPAEALMVPMGLARPERAYRYALIATVGSVLGGIAGWMIGYYAYELVARPVLEFYGSFDKFELLRSSASRDAILLMLVTSGVAHLPPMKVVTILSGAAAVDMWLFIASAIVARGGKFFADCLAAPALRRADPGVHREAARADCARRRRSARARLFRGQGPVQSSVSTRLAVPLAVCSMRYFCWVFPQSLRIETGRSSKRIGLWGNVSVSSSGPVLSYAARWIDGLDSPFWPCHPSKYCVGWCGVQRGLQLLAN